MADKFKKLAQKLLDEADIKINGDRPWDIIVHNEKLYERVICQGSLGLGESYMDGWWDCHQLDEFFFRLVRADVQKSIKLNLKELLYCLQAKLFNLQNKTHSKIVSDQHYDLGNDLYRAMLDKNLVYTCAYWKNAQNLDEAQEAKLDLVCKKLQLKPGQKILDIGCGWGSFAKFAAERYGVHVIGITISQEQVDLANELCKGLPVEIRLQDYRDVNEPFDHIVSLGMFEHVGYKNYRTYMQVVQRCLKDDGLFLLHTIGGNRSVTNGDAWFEKYIFPGGMLPSIAQIGKSIEDVLVMEDWHNFGVYYDRTLLAWFDNFNRHWLELAPRYGERFYRMWSYYLLQCAGLFRARHCQLWQIVLSKKGLLGGYESIR
jgi:cyclopropane-fatty-acyl-phospholipid synthase